MRATAGDNTLTSDTHDWFATRADGKHDASARDQRHDSDTKRERDRAGGCAARHGSTDIPANAERDAKPNLGSDYHTAALVADE